MAVTSVRKTQRRNVEQPISTAPTEEISRPTEELVIGLVGAVGAGVSTTCKIIKRILEDDFGYAVTALKASEIIRENAIKVCSASVPTNGSARIMQLQKVGTLLRSKFGEDYVAAKAIEKIATERKTSRGYDETTQVPQPLVRRTATIIDSLKHPNECHLLRRVYGGIYWQFTVFAPEKVRETRLNLLGINKTDLSGIFTRDDDDNDGDHGQKVSKTAYLSDFFVRNDGQNDVNLQGVIDRFLEIVFNISVKTPTTHEAGMYAAVSASGKSACLSRQVGAAIYSNDGELVSIGWNDVPKALGGLYSSEQGADDHRCYKWAGKVCHNDRKKDELYQKIFEQLNLDNLLSNGVDQSSVRSALMKTPVRNLIEYSRSIHAEMEAIVSASRAGKKGLVGGTLYTTTFPCHNCARHIVAAGIAHVYYIEPYAKSLALELHSDSIDVKVDADGGMKVPKKVAFLQYEGVGPDSMMKLFHHGIERKDRGSAIVLDKKNATPVLPPPMDGFTTHEKRVMTHLESVEAT